MNKYRNIFCYSDLEHYLRHGLNEIAQVSLWNEYCEKMGYEDMIHSMSDIDNIFGMVFPSDLFKKLADSFNWNDDYFYFGHDGYLHSTDFPEKVISFYYIIKYILDNSETFGNEEIARILDEEE